MFFDNYDKNSDMLNKNNLRKYIFNSNLINLDNEFGTKLEFDYQQHFGKVNHCRTKKKSSLHCRQSKHTIAEILGIKQQQPERKKEKLFDSTEMHNDSDSDSVYSSSQVRSTSPDYKSGSSMLLTLSFDHILFTIYLFRCC